MIVGFRKKNAEISLDLENASMCENQNFEGKK